MSLENNMIFIKALIGAFAVLLIQFFSQSRYYYLAALVPLFPTFALISHVVLGTTRSPDEFKNALLFSMFSLIPYFGYVLGVYLSVDRFPLRVSLIIGTLTWVVLATLLVIIWKIKQ